MPTDDPSVAGFTNTGNRNFFLICLQHASRAPAPIPSAESPGTARSAVPPARRAASARPCPCPRRKPARPRPRTASPASSSSPCTVPSSPNVPCSTGNITSTAMLGCPAPCASGTRAPAVDRAAANAFARFQDFGQHLLRPRAHEPAAILGDADGHGFVFFRIERANHRCRRGQRHFVLARTPAEQHAHPQSLVSGNHRYCLAFSLRADHRIFFPRPESTSSTPSVAVVLCKSITGLISTSSKETIDLLSAIISSARCASR